MSNDHSGGRMESSGGAIERGARWLLFATLLAPLLVFPGFLFPFVTIRAVYFRVLVELTAALLLYLILRREVKVDLKRDIVLWALAAWVAANALAAGFGVAPLRSLFGDHERMGGAWFWIHLFAYYVALRTVLRPDDWWRFFRVAIAVAVLVAGYGQYQLWIRHVDTGSTIGNNGLLAIYLLANVALCALLAVRAGSRARLGYLAVAMFLIVAIVLSGNRSSTLALLVGCGVGFVSFWFWSRPQGGWRAVVVAASIVLVAALPFAISTTWRERAASRVPAFKRLTEGVDSTRVIQWRAAVEGIRDRPLLGVGPENYQIVWSRFYHPEMYRFMGDSRWDRAHNAFLDAFATAGILGFLALLAVWIALAWTTARSARRSQDATASDSRPGSQAADAVVFGFFAGFAFHLVFWFFDLNSTMPWIALAAFIASRESGTPLIAIGAVRGRRWQTVFVLGVGGIALLALLYVHAFETLRMARALDRARAPQRALQDVLADYESVFSSPAPVTQHAFFMYAGRLSDLYPRFEEIRNDPAQSELFDRAFVLAITEFERQAKQDPLNERVLVQHARVLMLGAYYYGNMRLYESALDKLQRAVTLSPRRVNTHLVLGVAYLNAGLPDRALRTFQQAYVVYPPLGQTHSYIAQAYAALGKQDSAAVWARSAVANGVRLPHDFVSGVARELITSDAARFGAELVWDYLREQTGPLFLWADRGDRSNGAEAELAALAADLFSSAGDIQLASAIRASAPALCVHPGPLLSLAGEPSRFVQVIDAPTCREPWRSSEFYR